MIIESLNIGLPRREVFQGKELVTGICKQPVDGPIFLSINGFEGDGVGDLKHHGGKDKAVCAYSLDHYPFWERELGITMPPASFGENLSISGLKEDDICIGDMYKAGAALLQVSQPRQPCKTLAARYGRTDLVKLVVETGRTGLYFRVLEEGTVEAGNPLALVEQDPAHVSVSYANRIYHHDRKNREGIEKILSLSALSDSWRRSFIELKEKA